MLMGTLRLFRSIVGLITTVSTLAVVVVSSPSNVQAATGINDTINFQGRLFTSSGATVADGYYNIQFKIYQDGTGQAAGNPGGTLEWTENHLNSATNGVQVKNGFLSVELGSVNAFGTSVDWNQNTLWLSMQVGDTSSCTVSTSFLADCSGDGEMLPMKRLSSSVYALNAGQLGGLTSDQFLQIAQGVQTDASTNTTSIFLNKTAGGNFFQLQSSAVDVYTVTNSGDVEFGSNADHTISVATAGASTDGNDLSVTAGAGGSGTGNAGGDLVLQGGAGGGTDGDGGGVVINGGGATGTGTNGTVSIGTSNTSAITLGAPTTVDNNLTVSGSGTVAFQKGADYSSLTSDDVDFGSGTVFRLTGASTQTITGIAGGVDGRIITLINAAAQAATLDNESTSSAAANRIITGTGASVDLAAGSSMSLVYDASDSRWRIVGSAGATTGDYIQLQPSSPGTAQTGNFNISGTGMANVIQGATSVLSPLFDTASVAALGIGTANASSITIGQAGVTTTVAGDLTVDGTTTLSDDVSIVSGKTLTVAGDTRANIASIGSPTPGMITYDQTNNQLLTYNGTKWQADGKEAILVAANDSSQADKDAADYVADGAADEVEINNALTAADPAGSGRKTGRVFLFAGTYTAAATINIPNNTTLAGAGNGTVIELGNLDTTENLIENTDQTTGSPGGTGVRIENLKLDGRSDLNTAGTQYGIYLKNMGSGTGASAKPGAKVTNINVTRFRTTNIYLEGSSNGQFSNINTQASGASGVTGSGFSLTTSSIHNNLSNVTSQGNTGYGVLVDSSSYNTLNGIIAQGNTGNSAHHGVFITGSDYVSLSNSFLRQNTGNGLTITSSSYTAVTGNTIYTNSVDGVNVTNSTSTNFSITGNTTYNNTGDGFDISGTQGSVTANTAVSNVNGFVFSGSTATNVASANVARANSNAGFYINGADDSSFIGNELTNNTTYGFQIVNADRDLFSGNRIVNNGGSGTNNGIHLTTSSNNTIIGNMITDTSATLDNAITIASGTTNYISDNTLDSGAISDSGTNTRYGGQVDASGNYKVQPAGTIELQANTNVTGTLTATTALQAPLIDAATASTELNIGTTNASQINLNQNTTLNGDLTLGNAANRTISIATSAASTAGRQLTIAAGAGGSGAGSVGGDLVLQGGGAGGTNANGGSIYLDAGAKTGTGTDGTIALGTVRASTIQIGSTTLSSGTQTINIGNNNTSGGTTNVVIGSGGSTTGGTTTLQAKDGIAINTNGVTRQTFNNTNTVYFGNGVTAAAPNDFTISGTGSTTTAVTGGSLSIQGGNATIGNANGGNITLAGGTGSGTGTNGLVLINSAAYSTAAAQNSDSTTSGINTNITQANIDLYGAIIVNATGTAQSFTLNDPTLGASAVGRLIYVTAANGSNDFTLLVNGGGTGNTIAMRQNTTATMIWNGSDWTAAGASSSTTLQSAYDNTLQSAGGAELVVSATSNTNGLTIRDSSVNPVNGTLLSVQTQSAAGLISVNSNVTEYASNAGAETAGGSATTFPSSTWSAINSATVSRHNTAGNYIATGQGSVKVITSTTVNNGAVNQLTSALTAGTTYNVSMAVRLDAASPTFTGLDVYYSVDGSALTTACTTNQTVPTSVWKKVNCTFTAPTSGITSSNAIIIKQGGTTVRTFYIDNLSVTIAADFNLASDGSVNSALGTNWTAVSGASVVRSTSYGEDASDSVAVTATGAGGDGARNKLSVNPLPSTLYRISVYAASSNTFDDFTIRYSRNGGTSFDNCTDYNTQSVSTSLTNFTKITCYVTTSSTAASDPYVYFTQASGPARTFYVDAFNMTLSSNSTPNVQIGGGVNGGPATLLTLDRAASAPIAANNDALLGSMYYDTTLGKLQCYEADGWGACGSSPDNIVTISPEYTNAVLNGTGIGTMSSNLCSDTLNINDGSSGQPTICGTNETYNFYKWTSPQASAQTYSIYVTYQLPATFKTFASGQTSIMGRTDSTNATVQYDVYRNSTSGLSQCGSAVSVSTGSVSTWQTGVASGAADPSTCGFAAGDSIVFKINMTASSNANAYVGNLNFTFSNR